MTAEFDPYHRWLGIPPKHQPPNLYRLLGTEPFESDPEVIQDAAERQIAHVRRYAMGQNRDISQKLLSELAVAKATLLDFERKRQYDGQLRNELRQSNYCHTEQPAWIVGSSPACDIVVDEPPVSSVHCRVTKTSSGYRFEDLDSTNGTVIDGTKIDSPRVVPFQHPVTLGKRTPFPWKEILLAPRKSVEPAEPAGLPETLDPPEGAPPAPIPGNNDPGSNDPASVPQPEPSSSGHIVLSFQFWVALLIAVAIFSVVLMVFMAIAG